MPTLNLGGSGGCKRGSKKEAEGEASKWKKKELSTKEMKESDESRRGGD